MDLTEIMDFLDSLEDSNKKKCSIEEDEAFEKLGAMGRAVMKPPKRSRANTWHGNVPLNEDKCINEMSHLESVKDSSIIGTPPKVSPGQTIISRKSIARRNAWGNLSYADMITQAINSSIEKRMTLSEIYNWMVQNIPFFRDKGESNSSAGWKNSIRHNLSLHNCFIRIQNDGAGKSSWWMLNPDYRVTRPQRRRANTMDLSKSPTLHHRRIKSFGKKEKQNSSLADSTTIDTPQIKEEMMDSCEELLGVREFRPRSKTISTKFTKLSPTFELEDQEDTDQMQKRRFFENENDIFFRDRNDLNTDNKNSFHQSSHQPPHPLHFIPIPSSDHRSECKSGSLPAAWNYRNHSFGVNNHLPISSHHFNNNNHSMSNIKSLPYSDNYPNIGQNNGSRLLSGGNVVRGHVFRRAVHNNFYNRPLNNNNNTYPKKCIMDNSTDHQGTTTTTKSDLMSGGLQVTSDHSWPPHYQQQHPSKENFQRQHHPNKQQHYPHLQNSKESHGHQQQPKDHALLLHLLTDKDQQQGISDHQAPDAFNFQKIHHQLPFNSLPPQYPSMLQHLLTTGHKRSPNQTYFSPPPELEPIPKQYLDPNNNIHYKFPLQFPPNQNHGDYNHHSSMQFPSSFNFNIPQVTNTSPSKTYSDDVDSPSDHITSDQYLSTTTHPKITTTTSSEIPEDLASLDSLFSSDLDGGFDSPSNIEQNISQVINLEKSLGDPLDLDLITNAFNFP